MGEHCQDHSGVCSEVSHLSHSDNRQWKEINNMKRLLIGTLVSGVFTLLGVVINLTLYIVRAAGTK